MGPEGDPASLSLVGHKGESVPKAPGADAVSAPPPHTLLGVTQGGAGHE